MATVVIKRDGCRTGFNVQRIQQAVASAARGRGRDDAVWCEQVAGPYPQLARTYIEYRHDRDVARDRQSQLHHAIRGLVDQTNSALLNEAEIEPPKSIATATAVTTQTIAQVASHIYGGTTINQIDEVLAPFVER